MNFIPSIVLSSVLLLTLTACNSGNEAKPKDTQTSEHSNADATETPPQSEDDFPPVDKSFLEDETYNAEEVTEPTPLCRNSLKSVFVVKNHNTP